MGPMPSRRAMAALLVVSVALPGALLAWVLAHDDERTGAAGSEQVNAFVAGRARLGQLAPDFRLATLGGEQFRLTGTRGSPVVLTFFASWCHPCEEELPLLEAAHEKQPNDFKVVAVSFEDLPRDSKAFVKRLGVKYPALFDGGNDVAHAYGVRGIPATFFIDSDGVIRDRVHGITSRDALEKPLLALLRRSR
jgi:peroxiredoxin